MRKKTFYEKYIKRMLDILFSLIIIVPFFWIYIFVYIIVAIKMGTPVIFKQPRPGIKAGNGEEKIFNMYKFRTMTDARDKDGKLLPDNERLTGFGKMLRRTSLDEIPEIFNVLKGDMSFIGPRPFLVRDMVFMTPGQRMRHSVRPGITGLAQVNGRNAITWEKKIDYDLRYMERITLKGDVSILFKTVKKIFCRSESFEELDVTDDFGDALLKEGKVSKERYDELQDYAVKLLEKCNRRKNN